MIKAFCIIGIQPKGPPLSQAGEALGPLVEAAKAARLSGELDGKPVKEVFVLSSVAIGPVVHYRCAKPAPAKAKK